MEFRSARRDGVSRTGSVCPVWVAWVNTVGVEARRTTPTSPLEVEIGVVSMPGAGGNCKRTVDWVASVP